MSVIPGTRPDVVLLDIKLPGMWGSEGVNLVLKRFPCSNVLMLKAFEDEARIIESQSEGASG